MWSALGSVLLGVMGWLITSFFAKPLIDFLDLRRKVHEEIVYTGNIGAMQLGQEEDRAKFDEAVEDLRRLGAKVQATNVAATWPLRIFLSRFGYDLGKAGRGLIGLSNSLHLGDGSRELQTNWVQKGMKLPCDYRDEQLKTLCKSRLSREEVPRQ